MAVITAVTMGQELTTAAAAARLGVKQATLYAYVSRGLLHRRVAVDGRTSLFDADEIDAYRSRRRRNDGPACYPGSGTRSIKPRIPATTP